jgi:hypothetical protein
MLLVHLLARGKSFQRAEATSRSRRTFRIIRIGRIIRVLGCFGGLALLAACASHPQIDARQEASQYLARASRDYTPPGPPEDPWGPYIMQASKRFDVPDRWIREVMRVESGGREYLNGQLITSPVGAMGLMQIMPETFDEMRARYKLGDDPYHPFNSIMAGTAYIREMYDVYGSPGFLAAYNAGPARLDDYLQRNRPLPDETRRYVAMIGPYIQDSWPQNRSPAEQMAINALPIDIPPGPRWGRAPERSYAERGAGGRNTNERIADRRQTRGAVQVASLPEPPRAPVLQEASAIAPATHGGRGFHLINSAMAEPVPLRRGGPATGEWAIQVGAYGNESLAHAAANSARERAEAGGAHASVGAVRQGRTTLYRARLTGMSRDSAIRACERISHGHGSCMVLSPDGQS